MSSLRPSEFIETEGSFGNLKFAVDVRSEDSLVLSALKLCKVLLTPYLQNSEYNTAYALRPQLLKNKFVHMPKKLGNSRSALAPILNKVHGKQ